MLRWPWRRCLHSGPPPTLGCVPWRPHTPCRSLRECQILPCGAVQQQRGIAWPSEFSPHADKRSTASVPSKNIGNRGRPARVAGWVGLAVTWKRSNAAANSCGKPIGNGAKSPKTATMYWRPVSRERAAWASASASWVVNLNRASAAKFMPMADTPTSKAGFDVVQVREPAHFDAGLAGDVFQQSTSVHIMQRTASTTRRKLPANIF